MLDKLEFSKLYYKDGVSSSDDVFTTLKSYENEPESFCLAFQNHLSSLLGCSVRFEKASRGRLGRTFKCVLGNGKVLFCKTHQQGDRYKQIIEKEYYFLTHANPSVVVNFDIFTHDGYDYAYMLQEWLDKPAIIKPEDALELIDSYNKRLFIGTGSQPYVGYSLIDLINVSKEELVFLENSTELSQTFCKLLNENIAKLEQDLPEYDKVICHGDFGDNNIMQSDAGSYIVIDWEDTFTGIKGYDFLYWLTFFCHRKFYSSNMFKQSGIDCRDARGIISVIMTIKTALTVYSGLNKNNSISSEERIAELLSYCNY